MFDTRLIYQVVEWEKRNEIENEKKGNYRHVVNAPFSHCFEYCCKAAHTILAQTLNSKQGSKVSSHTSASDRTLERPAYNASHVQ
jgi:PP-loop superfamily ATP-utilizing enzyme